MLHLVAVFLRDSADGSPERHPAEGTAVVELVSAYAFY
jgi:hypothetical protein